jgi:ElaA protein
MKITWVYKNFEELSPFEIYNILKLRQEIFIVEQHCAYLDADNKDLHSFHLAGYDSTGHLACYARIVKPGISYAEVSIGRVTTAATDRGKGYGKLLIEEALRRIENTFGKVPIRIGAQGYLSKFYQSFGFEITDTKGYFEDGILHFIMIRN